jgi:hypothetical protein
VTSQVKIGCALTLILGLAACKHEVRQDAAVSGRPDTPSTTGQTLARPLADPASAVPDGLHRIKVKEAAGTGPASLAIPPTVRPVSAVLVRFVCAGGQFSFGDNGERLTSGGCSPDSIVGADWTRYRGGLPATLFIKVSPHTQWRVIILTH